MKANNPNTIPQVFISYAHEGDLSVKVEQLADWLRKKGINAITDHPYKDRPPEKGWRAWMQHNVEDADILLVVCSHRYKSLFEKRETGSEGGFGVSWEAGIITSDLYYSRLQNSRIYPILPDDGKHEHVPNILKDWHNNHRFPSKYDGILRLIKNKINIPTPEPYTQSEPNDAGPVAKDPRKRPVKISKGEVEQQLQLAATEDIDVFRRSQRWPSTEVPLSVHIAELGQPVQTSALVHALSELGDLVLVAPPGMGKTSTLLQIASGLIDHGKNPMFMPLADWATEGKTLLESILGRATFRGKIVEDDFRIVAQQPGTYLLLDGWNELDRAARKRATVELKRLQLELPALGLFVSTRKQSLDVPFDATKVELQPLGEVQQMEIARTLRGDDGQRIVDEAWRTPGVRELVTIPLYLTSLLSLPSDQSFPKTKEEVLRLFVQAHEQQADRAESLQECVNGLQSEFLRDLAVTATQAGNTSISETIARRSVSQTDDCLITEGQLAIKLQTIDVLDTLVDHHLLVRTGDPAGYSFQHQQFQEWYAANEVERAILKSVGNANALQELKSKVLNATPWEEPILFAVERMACGDERQQQACGRSIIAAFEVDPTLAAEMIFRSTDTVWAQISEDIQKLVLQWHTPGNLDRSVRFMITSGRPEFRYLVWPLMTNENDQRSLPALRASRRFRPSVLGPNAVADILSLPLKARETIVSEIAYNSGMDGLDLASLVAQTDPDPKLKAAVISCMSFRQANRHVEDVLSTASDETFDLVYQEIQFEEIVDENVKERLVAARARAEKTLTEYGRLHTIVHTRDGKDQGVEITELVATIEIKDKQDTTESLIYEASKHYEQSVAKGLLKRLEEGRELFHGAANILAASAIVVENDALLDLVLSPHSQEDNRAEAAVSILGPISIGKLIDAKLAMHTELSKLSKSYESLRERYYGLRTHITHAPRECLVSAIRERADKASNEEISELAELLCLSNQENDKTCPFSNKAHVAVGHMAEQWGQRLIASGDDATRRQLSAVADLIGNFPSVELLPILKQLLDDELRRYRTFRQQAEAEHWQGDAANEAGMQFTNRYQQAFTAIKSPQTTEIMITFLLDEHFGETAALVLKVQWILANEPPEDRRFSIGVDFTRVEEMRAQRTCTTVPSCTESESIFDAIAPIILEHATEAEKKHAIKLAIQAVRLPHGERPDTIGTLLKITTHASGSRYEPNPFWRNNSVQRHSNRDQ